MHFFFVLYIILFLHQTTTLKHVILLRSRCISSCSYIKPQRENTPRCGRRRCISSCSYIKPQLGKSSFDKRHSCISSCSYIKPQLVMSLLVIRLGCISSCSYIKPQQGTWCSYRYLVVYHLVPTSNHNNEVSHQFILQLYIILFLHQTTTVRLGSPHSPALYIILFLHQTTTVYWTTTNELALYIILFLHQTTTGGLGILNGLSLYIILFLHQTTTSNILCSLLFRCISSCSYIKPQPLGATENQEYVVYHLVPTSNHNQYLNPAHQTYVVYHLVPTSNHN